MHVNPHLNFSGNCAEAFKFYEELLGAKIIMTMTHGQSPMATESPADWQDKVMHSALKVGDTTLLGMDAPPGRYERPSGVWISLEIKEPQEAERVFAALAEAGHVVMPVAETFWAHRFGMVKDRFGVPWMINCSKPMPADA